MHNLHQYTSYLPRTGRNIKHTEVRPPHAPPCIEFPVSTGLRGPSFHPSRSLPAPTGPFPEHRPRGGTLGPAKLWKGSKYVASYRPVSPQRYHVFFVFPGLGRMRRWQLEKASWNCDMSILQHFWASLFLWGGTDYDMMWQIRPRCSCRSGVRGLDSRPIVGGRPSRHEWKFSRRKIT
jgi:hypothetical protein